MLYNKRMEKKPRLLAVEILNRVEKNLAYAEPLLEAALKENYLPNVHDRRLLTELVFGTLRMQGYLDWVIERYLRGRSAPLPLSVKNILRTAFYQFMHTSRIPIYAIVDEAVKLTRQLAPGNEALVNALLRNYLRHREEALFPQKRDEAPLEYISIVHAHPRWLVKKWLSYLGIEETERLCQANNERPPFTVRVNTLKIDRTKAIDELKEAGIEAGETPYAPEGLFILKGRGELRFAEAFTKGHFVIQDEASQLIAHLLSPRPGERVLDCCAGRGIKTTHLAQLMENKGVITAIDLNERKLALLRELSENLGITIVATKAGDATGNAAVEEELYDRVLLDAPCSGLGTVRRKPEIKWRLKAKEIAKLSSRQKDLIKSAARLVKKGGVLLYAVCTIMPEENEKVIEDFLKDNPDFTVETVEMPLYPSSLFFNERGFFRTFPHIHNTDGFFACLLRKKS